MSNLPSIDSTLHFLQRHGLPSDPHPDDLARWRGRGQKLRQRFARHRRQVAAQLINPATPAGLQPVLRGLIAELRRSESVLDSHRDDELGLAWWNNSSEQQRLEACRAANTCVPAKAWRYWKAHQIDVGTVQENTGGTSNG